MTKGVDTEDGLGFRSQLGYSAGKHCFPKPDLFLPPLFKKKKKGTSYVL